METTFDPLQLTDVDLDSLSRERIHALALQASGCVLRGRILLGRCLLSMQRTQMFRTYGASSVVHYAINWLGCARDEAYDVLSVARRLEGLPLLTQAAENGRVGWCALRAVLRRATPENEAMWLEEAQTSSMNRLLWLLRNDGTPEAEREADMVRVEFWIAPEVSQMLQRATRRICQGQGRRVPAGEILELVLAEFEAGAEGCSVEQVREESRRDLEPPWAAVQVEESPCPGNPAVTLASSPSWAQRIAFNAAARHVTTAQQTLLLRRDRYRCSTPGCPNNLWLQMHHIVFYCEGGATVPENLITVCSACHGNIHAGHLMVNGIPPNGLEWTTASGWVVGVPQFAEMPPWAAGWLDTG